MLVTPFSSSFQESSSCLVMDETNEVTTKAVKGHISIDENEDNVNDVENNI